MTTLPNSLRRFFGSGIVVALFVFSLGVHLYHILTHQALLLPTILGQWVPVCLALVFGGVGYAVLTTAETARERTLVGVRTGTAYLLGGIASGGYAFHQYLSPEVSLPADAVLFQATFVAIVVGIAGLGLSVESIRRDRTYQELEELIEEKENLIEGKATLLHEVHHRVKNNLQVIVSLLGLQKRKIQDPELTRILENCQNRVTSMAMVHRKIYEIDVSSAVDLSDYIPDLTKHLLESQSSTDAKISTKFDLESCRLPLDQMVTLGMVFSELITNAVEHAFKEREQGTIRVEGRSEEDELVRLSVRDDGVGWTPDGPLSEENSLGLQLVANLVQKQLGGTIEFEQNNGSTVHLSIPLESS